jgi:excinuclease ABC subunit C
LAENRPGIYMMINSAGKVIYVGKSRQLRTRLLSYFRAEVPHDKAARIIHAARDLRWHYQPSDFAAELRELRLIKEHRPVYNNRMNRTKKWVFVKVSGSPAPKIYTGGSLGPDNTIHYGPFASGKRVREGVRVLNDLYGLRDCALKMPIAYSGQADLFNSEKQAACMRYELGTCAGPCGGFVAENDYAVKMASAKQFLEGRSVEPFNLVIGEMERTSEDREYESAERWRDKFESLEWLFSNINRARAMIDSLSFVYINPGSHGDERAYVINRALVKAQAPAPRTPIEWEAFRASVEQHSSETESDGPLNPETIDETLLVLSWFRRHPAALRRTYPFPYWLNEMRPPA